MRYNKELITQTKEVMLLRYGTEEPSKEKLPKPLLTMAFVAKLLKITRGRVNYLSRLYF